MTTAPVLLVGRYRLGEVLGAGVLGGVWRAHDQTLGREVVIKEILLPAEFDIADRDAVRRRTLREARAAARLNHPNVVQVYDVLQVEDQTWIVMEYVPSRSLQQVIDEGPLDPGRTATIGLDVLDALEAAHNAGVRHRDVKPANVLLAEDGRVVLTDFGIATIEGDSVVTRSGLVTGSPAFMSPERARYGTAGVESDLWSLGATLYAAVEGRTPYRRASTIEMLTALVSDEPDPPVHAGALKPVLDGLLRKDPAQRIDVGETRRLLQAAEAGSRIPEQRRSPEAAVPPEMPETPEPVDEDQAAVALPADALPADALPADALPADDSDEPRADDPPADDPPADDPPADGPRAVEPAAVEPRAVEPPADGPRAAEPAVAEPAPARTGPSRRRMGIATVVVLALAVAAVIWVVTRTGSGVSAGGDPGRTAATTAPPAAAGPGAVESSPAAPSTSAPAGSAAPPSAGGPSGSGPSAGGPSAGGPSAGGPSSGQGSGGAQRPELPAGWRDYRDPTGFSVYVPDGWTRSTKGSIVYFRDRETGRVLGIDQTDRPKSDPVADWRGQASYRVQRGDFPGYREIRITAVDYGQKAADWEYTFDGRVRQHVNNRGLVVSKSKAYGIYWQTSDADWKAARSDLQLVFDSFRAAGS